MSTHDASGSSSAQTVAPATPLSRRKSLLFSVVLVLILLGFAEVSLQLFYRVTVGRWLWQWWAVPIYEADPIRVYRLKSNLDFVHKTSEFTARYRTDALGLRTDGSTAPLTPAKPDEVFRILALGPSFAFGWGANYEDAYVYKIASGLRVPGKRVELINLGTPAQPIPFQLKWLRQTGYVYQPDLVVQTVYGELDKLENDDRLPPVLPYVKDGYLQSREESWLKKVRRWSATLFYIWHGYNWLTGTRAREAGDGRELYREDDAATASECLARYRGYIQFVHAAVTNRPQLVFLHVPLSYVVRPVDAGRFSKPLDPGRTRVRTAELASVLQSNQVQVIDPSDALVAGDKSERMYNLYDIHFTPAGNRVVADYALPRIQRIVDRR